MKCGMINRVAFLSCSEISLAREHHREHFSRSDKPQPPNIQSIHQSHLHHLSSASDYSSNQSPNHSTSKWASQTVSCSLSPSTKACLLSTVAHSASAMTLLIAESLPLSGTATGAYQASQLTSSMLLVVVAPEGFIRRKLANNGSVHRQELAIR